MYSNCVLVFNHKQAKIGGGPPPLLKNAFYNTPIGTKNLVKQTRRKHRKFLTDFHKMYVTNLNLSEIRFY